MKLELPTRKHERHKRESFAARIALTGVVLASGVLFLRALPDVVRYLRIRRM